MKEQLKRIIDSWTVSGIERNHIEITAKFHSNPDYFSSTLVRLLNSSAWIGTSRRFERRPLIEICKNVAGEQKPKRMSIFASTGDLGHV